MDTISVNGLVFARGFGDERANAPATAVSGLFEVNRGGVLLMEADRTPVALICGNGTHGSWTGGGFIVTAHVVGSGSIRYMFSTTSGTDRRLGLERMTYSGKIEVARSVLDQARPLAHRWLPVALKH